MQTNCKKTSLFDDEFSNIAKTHSFSYILEDQCPPKRYSGLSFAPFRSTLEPQLPLAPFWDPKWLHSGWSAALKMPLAAFQGTLDLRLRDPGQIHMQKTTKKVPTQIPCTENTIEIKLPVPIYISGATRILQKTL